MAGGGGGWGVEGALGRGGGMEGALGREKLGAQI